MICKDCIHEELCVYEDEATSECSDFKDKTQVVEVVRCKDCEYVLFNTSSEKYHCKRRGYFSEEVNGTDYCSYGKKVK